LGIDPMKNLNVVRPKEEGFRLTDVEGHIVKDILNLFQMG